MEQWVEHLAQFLGLTTREIGRWGGSINPTPLSQSYLPTTPGMGLADLGDAAVKSSPRKAATVAAI